MWGMACSGRAMGTKDDVKKTKSNLTEMLGRKSLL